MPESGSMKIVPIFAHLDTTKFTRLKQIVRKGQNSSKMYLTCRSVLVSNEQRIANHEDSKWLLL
jgi:hypothetical protein